MALVAHSRHRFNLVSLNKIIDWLEAHQSRMQTADKDLPIRNLTTRRIIGSTGRSDDVSSAMSACIDNAIHIGQRVNVLEICESTISVTSLREPSVSSLANQTVTR